MVGARCHKYLSMGYIWGIMTISNKKKTRQTTISSSRFPPWPESRTQADLEASLNCHESIAFTKNSPPVVNRRAVL